MSMARISKKRRLEIFDELRADERLRVMTLLEEAGIYTKILMPLIDNYLDAYLIYKIMYEQWRDEGFPATISHQNKAGAVNEMKHPLAQQVENWNDRKNKILDYLGMTNKGKITTKSFGKNLSNEPIDELAAHRNKWRQF